jgi:hypothetical protein
MAMTVTVMSPRGLVRQHKVHLAGGTFLSVREIFGIALWAYLKIITHNKTFLKIFSYLLA